VELTPRELTVRDTGIGIPPKDLSRIFERRYRGAQSRGLGLGSSGCSEPLVETSTTRSGSVIASGSPGSWPSGRNSAWIYSIIWGLKAQTDSFPAQ